MCYRVEKHQPRNDVCNCFVFVFVLISENFCTFSDLLIRMAEKARKIKHKKSMTFCVRLCVGSEKCTLDAHKQCIHHLAIIFTLCFSVHFYLMSLYPVYPPLPWPAASLHWFSRHYFFGNTRRNSETTIANRFSLHKNQSRMFVRCVLFFRSIR